MTKSLASLKLTVFGLSLAFVLVLAATLAQVKLGIYYATHLYFGSFFVSKYVFGHPIPILPGGYFVVLLLLVNLSAAFIKRFKLKTEHLGLILIHAGLIVLLADGLLTGLFSQESRVVIRENERRNWSEDYHKIELAIIDITTPQEDVVYSLPDTLLKPGSIVSVPTLGLAVKVDAYHANSELLPAAQSETLATRDLGTRFRIRPLPINHRDDAQNLASAYITLADAQNNSLGTWLVSTGIGVSQKLDLLPKSFRIELRHKRYYTPYYVYLKDFKHDTYPGTNIPRNFSSAIVVESAGKTPVSALIYMNHPLRMEGKTYYQASFGDDDKMSVLQVVENPSWLLPYVSCFIISLGLLLTFAMRLSFFLRKRVKNYAQMDS